MGIKVKDVVSGELLPLFIDSMMCTRHEFTLSPIIYNTCMLFDWTRRREKEVLCEIHLKDGYFCTFSHSPKNPGIAFRKEVLGKSLGKVIGIAPFKDDLSGIRDDIEYDFLDVESDVTMPGHEDAGSVQRITLRTVCD